MTSSASKSVSVLHASLRVAAAQAREAGDDVKGAALDGEAHAIEDALVVCALFNIIDRMADALDVAIPSAEGFARTAERLLEHGYL